jgi:hypothetical protein
LSGIIKSTSNTEWSEDRAERLIFKAGLYFDSPFMKTKNRFNFTVAKDSTSKLRFWCRDDFNKKGGALGNVDCFFEGAIREKSKPPNKATTYSDQEAEVQ